MHYTSRNKNFALRFHRNTDLAMKTKINERVSPLFVGKYILYSDKICFFRSHYCFNYSRKELTGIQNFYEDTSFALNDSSHYYNHI